jgi:medium-chain acyl-[acyl-carrier-protein] hydrolase
MPLVETLTTALSAYLDKPFACFGHSLGGLLSFELARELRRRANPLPRCLFISGRGAPHLPILRFSDGDAMRSPIHGIPDSAFIAELQRLNGTPEIVLQHQELMQLLLPTIRADFELFETYVYQPEPPLDCPIVAFGGLQDSEATKETLEAWQAQTQGYFRLQMFPGNHFFLQTAQALLLSALTQHLML